MKEKARTLSSTMKAGAGVMGEQKSLDLSVKIDAVKTDFSLPSDTTLGDIAILVSTLAERVGSPVQEVTVTTR